LRGVYLNPFVNIEPVQKSKDGRDMRRFRSFNDSVLNLLEAIRKIAVQRVTVVEFGVDNRESNSTGCFRIKCIWTDTTTEFTDMRTAVYLVISD